MIQPAQLVPVLYADHTRCGAPGFSVVLELARQAKSRFLLIDTFIKDGKRLTDYLDHSQLSDAILAARECGIGVVLAGSLQAADLPMLLPLKPTAIAIKGRPM